MRGYSAQQIRDAEAPHLAAGEPLMARAAAALADRCERVLMDSGVALAHARVVVLVGGGNNGGDALFAAAKLAGDGMSVELVRTAERVHAAGLDTALAAGAVIVDASPAKVAASARAADLVIDGILGTGTSPDPRLRGAGRDIVAALVAASPPAVEGAEAEGTPAEGAEADTAARPTTGSLDLRLGAPRRRPVWPKVVAVDIPSGIHPDTGAVPEPEAVLRADVTVTCGGCKAGLLLAPARGFAGDIRVIDIGLAADLEKLTPLVDLPD
ncbi:MAG: NAD(P)H-hydrate epimerase [Microbacteriaceae bacterium]|nr:NAD(P)H-hydrate epimerase [Microbacteriaceae bacterium]MCL2793902.1 NAD(P)H-hydrate epimerase [Microbacteriaceae bacterium]